jgi:CSLREA domain-containing protein
MPSGSCRLRSLTLALGTILAGGSAHAAVITVTSTEDGSVAGQCTLRDAILAANDNAVHGDCAAGAAGHDDIVFAPGVAGTIFLTGGQLETLEEVSITGPGADRLAIDAQGNSRILKVTNDESTTTTISGLTFTGGRTTADNEGGGAISCLSALNLIDSVVTGNSTAGASSPGGALFTATTTNLTHSTVSGNWTEGYGSIAGGMIVVFGSGTLVDSTVADNWTEGSTSGGGGMVVFWGWFDATLINSTVSGNATFGDNSQAGGIAAGGNAILVNSTVSGNSTSGISGAGYSDAGALSVSGNVTLTNSTLVDNISHSGGFAINLANPDTTTLSAINTLIANTAASDGAGGGPLCSAPIGAAGSHNIATDASCGTDSLVGGAPTSTDALALGDLADNGGATRTHALLAGSAAIDAADAAACAADPVNGLDQRGQPRPIDGNGDGDAVCDVGAYEASETETIFRDGFE